MDEKPVTRGHRYFTTPTTGTGHECCSRPKADRRRAWTIGKKDWRSWRNLAAAYSEPGQHDKALGLASEASRLFPDQDLIKILPARTGRGRRPGPGGYPPRGRACPAPT